MFGKKRRNKEWYDDVAKIKNALLEASLQAKDKTEDMLSDSMDEIKKRSALTRDTIADYTAEKPFKSLGWALLTGLAIGYILKK